MPVLATAASSDSKKMAGTSGAGGKTTKNFRGGKSSAKDAKPYDKPKPKQNV